MNGLKWKGQVLKVSEVARILGLDDKTVYNRAKEIPGYIKLGGSVRFYKKSFFDWLEDSRPTRRPSQTRLSDKHGLTT